MAAQAMPLRLFCTQLLSEEAASKAAAATCHLHYASAQLLPEAPACQVNYDRSCEEEAITAFFHACKNKCPVQRLCAVAEADESDQMHALNSALMSLTPAQRSELRGMGFLKQEDFLSTRKVCSDLEKEYDGRHGLDCRVTKFISTRTNEYIRKMHSCEQRADGTWRRRKFRLPPVEATRAENRAAGIYRPIPVPYNMASSRSIQLTGQAMTSGWGISDSADGKASTMDARVVAAAAVDDLRTRQIYCGPSGCVERPRVQMLGDAFAWAKHNSACRWGFRCCDGDEYSNQPQHFKDVAFIANADDGW